MGDVVTAILNFLGGVARADDFLGALALVGVATAALIQAVKEVVPVRRWFHEKRLNAWVKRCAEEFANRERPVDVHKGECQLYCISVDGDKKALLNLPSEEMAEHMVAAMRAAVESPSHHVDLFLIGAHKADPEDIETLCPRVQRSTEEVLEPPTDQELVRIAEARSRVWYHMQRAVAGFEISVRQRWKWILQLISFVLSAGMVGLAVVLSTFHGTIAQGGFAARAGQVFFAAVLAGFLAPVARDLTVAIKRLREGSA